MARAIGETAPAVHAGRSSATATRRSSARRCRTCRFDLHPVRSGDIPLTSAAHRRKRSCCSVRLVTSLARPGGLARRRRKIGARRRLERALRWPSTEARPVAERAGTPPSGDRVLDIPRRPCGTARTSRSRALSAEIQRNLVTALIGPSGCGKIDVPPLPQPDERLDPRRAIEGEVLLPRDRHLRRRVSSRRSPAPDRHGLPEAESVPEVDLRQRRLWPARSTAMQGRRSTSVVEQALTRRRAVGRGQGSPANRARSRSPAVSSSGSASRARSRSSRRSC